MSAQSHGNMVIHAKVWWLTDFLCCLLALSALEAPVSKVFEESTLIQIGNDP